MPGLKEHVYAGGTLRATVVDSPQTLSIFPQRRRTNVPALCAHLYALGPAGVLERAQRFLEVARRRG